MEDSRKALVEKTIEVYETHIKAMQAAIPEIEKFDGKMYNKRFDNAILDAVKKVDGGMWFGSKTTCGILWLEFSQFNNFIRDGKYSVSYTDNRETNVHAGSYETVFTTTESGRWRVKAASIVLAVNVHIKTIQARIDQLRNALAQADTIRAEAQEMATAYVNFKEKYSSEVLDILGLYFELRNISRNKDYSVKTYK